MLSDFCVSASMHILVLLRYNNIAQFLFTDEFICIWFSVVNVHSPPPPPTFRYFRKVFIISVGVFASHEKFYKREVHTSDIIVSSY